MAPNVYANKPFLQNTMTQILAYGQQSVWTGTVTQATNTLTIVSTTSSGVALTVGSVVTITGTNTAVTITAGNASNTVSATFTVDISQTVGTAAAASGQGACWWGTVTQSTTTLTLDTTGGGGAVTAGTLIFITGALPVTALSGSGLSWTVSSSQTVTAGTVAYAVSYNVQNLLTTFLKGVSSTNYGYLFAGIRAGENSISGTSGTAANCALRTLVTIDDGSVAIDTSKSSSTNTYVNYNNKIKIVSTTVNSSNAVTVDGPTPATATLTIGSAGGNNINENHMSRPEILLAILSNNGTGFTSRFSSTLSANQNYLAQRNGLTTEEPQGIIRLSVPSVI